jgi:cell division protein FtsB
MNATPRRPSARRGQRGQTLILIFLGAMIFGGGAGAIFGGRSVSELRTRIRDVMTDQTQRATVDQTVDKLESLMKRYESERTQFEKDMFAALARHDTTPDELHALAGRADSLGAGARKEFVDLRFELRGELSDEQWREVFKPADAASK